MAILGTSMEPELKAGDLILIEEVSPSEVKVGDTIAFHVHLWYRSPITTPFGGSPGN